MTIWRPVEGNVFRLQVIRFTRTTDLLLAGDNVCWKLKIFGCSGT